MEDGEEKKPKKRRRKKEEEKDDDIIAERWSAKRILIATTILIIVAFAALYVSLLLRQKIQNTPVLGVSEYSQEDLPTEEEIQQIIKDTKKNLLEIETKNLIESQETIQKIIKDLEALQMGSVSAQDIFCELACKK